MISTPHSQSCLSVNGKLSLFPVSLFFPLWAKHCCYKNKNSEIPVLTKFGNSRTHEKKIFVSRREIGKVKIDSLAFLTLAHILTSGIGFLNDFKHIFREKNATYM